MVKFILNDFVAWQCKIRKNNFRRFNGKPSEGTFALILDRKSNKEISSFISILLERNPLTTLKMFQFMNKKTHDPKERFLKAINFFSNEYYDIPENFDGTFTATFPYESKIVKEILKKKKCSVQFFEGNTGFYFNVTTSKLKKNDSKWMYTYYHNLFFNPELNENIDILFFNPKKSELKKNN
tara:strand:- start:862 stop:1407 length:546 start_codon:yes stop_codon:yes gene_type:complete